jgi:predicted RNase H-like nuclease
MGVIRLVGIDCATQPKKVGLARGTYDNGLVTVEEVRCGHPNLEETVAKWLSGSGPALIALDAPLGWPAKLGRELSQHTAGQPLSEDELFNRETDRMIHKEIGRKPLDVGADRIARTARAALALLQRLREQMDVEITLAWSSQVEKIEAIEVYPAATLKAHGILHGGYKRPEQAEQRAEILKEFRSILSLALSIQRQTLNADELDAVACLLAARDFLDGNVIQPANSDVARREGWIWVRPPTAA